MIESLCSMQESKNCIALSVYFKSVGTFLTGALQMQSFLKARQAHLLSKCCGAQQHYI